MGRKIKIKITDDKEFTQEKEGLGFKKIFKSIFYNYIHVLDYLFQFL